MLFLSQTLQAFYEPEKVLKNLLRIGKSVIISIPNFGYWKVRIKLLLFGEMPVTKTLPNTWYNTPNLHMCTIKDLFNFCDEKNIIIKKVVGVNENKTSLIKKSNLEIKNLFSKVGIFLIVNMKVEIIPCLSDNFSYLIHDKKSNKVSIVDPAEYKACDNVIKKYKKLDFILNTHHHADHVDGNLELKKNITLKFWVLN